MTGAPSAPVVVLLFSVAERSYACAADVFPLVVDDVLGTVAENAGRLKLFQDDRVFGNEDLQRIALGDVKRSPQFDGKNDTSQLVHLAYDAGRFHVGTSSDHVRQTP